MNFKEFITEDIEDRQEAVSHLADFLSQSSIEDLDLEDSADWTHFMYLATGFAQRWDIPFDPELWKKTLQSNTSSDNHWNSSQVGC